MTRDPLHAKYQAARAELVGYALGCAFILVVVWMLPKDPQEHLVRLGLTIAFFTALATFFWSFSKPLRAFLMARASFRFQACGPDVADIALRQADSLAFLVGVVANILVVLASATMARVLVTWPEFSALQPLQSFLTLASWFALLAVPGFLLLFAPPLIAELWQLSRSLSFVLSTRDLKPMDEAEAERLAARWSQPPVSVIGAREFQAGGFDWRWGDFYKNAIVFGQTGSGKTLCVLNALIDGLLASTATGIDPHPPAGLILDPKGDFRGKIRSLCQRHGRAQDLLILDPASPAESIRWNPFDSQDDELELADRFRLVLESVGMKPGEDSFWIDSAKTFIRHALALVRATNPPTLPPSFQDILSLVSSDQAVEARIALVHAIALVRASDPAGNLRTAVGLLASPERLVDAAERVGTTNEATDRADRFFASWIRNEDHKRMADAEEAKRLLGSPGAPEANAPLPAAHFDARQAIDYFSTEWLPLGYKAEAQRAGVRSHIRNMIDQFAMRPYCDVFAGVSTHTISDMLDRGKILYVYMPVADREAMARVVCTFIKLEYQRQILTRPDKQRPSFFLCDEFQSFYTAGAGRGDADFFERSRQSNHANIIATQNLQALLKQTKDDKPVMNLLGNCGVKLFMRNTEQFTNQYASKLFGEARETVVNDNWSVSGLGIRNAMNAARGHTTSTDHRPIIEESAFARLVQPSAEERIDYAETIVHLGSRSAISCERLRWRVHPLDGT